MTNCKKLSVLLAAAMSCAITAITGCTRIQETWTYRAVPDAIVNRPYEPGSQGPLVLETVDPNAKPIEKPNADKAIDHLNAEQIAAFDHMMADKITRRTAASKALDELKGHGTTLGDKRLASAEQELADATRDASDYEKAFKARHRDSVSIVGSNLAPAAAAKQLPQTVLIASVRREAGTYVHSVGRTLVIFIDGKPQPGEYWLTSENSVLINFGPYSAPSRTRVGLRGSIRVISATDKEVVADMAVHDTTEADFADFNDAPYDLVNWELPWNVLGRHAFKIASPEDPLIKHAMVQWNPPAGSR